MTNEKLGVLLVDVPEPRLFKYYFLEEVSYNGIDYFNVLSTDILEIVKQEGNLYTKEEAAKYPKFRWVALEDL